MIRRFLCSLSHHTFCCCCRFCFCAPSVIVKLFPEAYAPDSSRSHLFFVGPVFLGKLTGSAYCCFCHIAELLFPIRQLYTLSKGGGREQNYSICSVLCLSSLNNNSCSLELPKKLIVDKYLTRLTFEPRSVSLTLL